MDPNTLNFLLSFASSVAATATTDGLKAAYQKIFDKRPDLEQRLIAAAGGPDTAEAMAEIAGEIEALAGTGMIQIDGAVIYAMRSAKFDHQDGTVTIGKSKISARSLIVGSASGTGRTTVGSDTSMTGSGSGMELPNGYSLVLTGDASIKFT